MAGILADAAEKEYEGELRVAPGAFRIPRSITVRKASVRQGEETVSLSIDASLARCLPPDGTWVRVKAVRKYITAFEVRHG